MNEAWVGRRTKPVKASRAGVGPGFRFRDWARIHIRFGGSVCTIRAMMIRSYKTGVEREQPSLLPPCVDDYVGRDNMVRAIDCYVDTLDLAKLGFVLAGCDGG